FGSLSTTDDSTRAAMSLPLPIPAEAIRTSLHQARISPRRRVEFGIFLVIWFIGSSGWRSRSFRSVVGRAESGHMGRLDRDLWVGRHSEVGRRIRPDYLLARVEHQRLVA